MAYSPRPRVHTSANAPGRAQSSEDVIAVEEEPSGELELTELERLEQAQLSQTMRAPGDGDAVPSSVLP